MLKGTRGAIVRRIQPVSVHGQVSWDLAYVFDDDPEEQLHATRIGPEAASRNLEAGDRVELEFLVGVVVKVTKRQS